MILMSKTLDGWKSKPNNNCYIVIHVFSDNRSFKFGENCVRGIEHSPRPVLDFFRRGTTKAGNQRC